MEQRYPQGWWWRANKIKKMWGLLPSTAYAVLLTPAPAGSLASQMVPCAGCGMGVRLAVTRIMDSTSWFGCRLIDHDSVLQRRVGHMAVLAPSDVTAEAAGVLGSVLASCYCLLAATCYGMHVRLLSCM
jgi:hypothetical protein